jgi:serine/threonine protein kinase
VKPQNILLDPDGRARLTDFGSARLDGQATVTATGSAVGTLDYMAPEVFRGQRGDARSDIYSLGLTLYFALTGKLPTSGSPHLPPSPQPGGFRPSLARPDVPGWIDRAIARMTAARPADRYPSGAVVSEALNPSAILPTPSPPPDAGALDFCLLCGVTDSLGLGLCPACGATIPEDQSVHVLLHPPVSAVERLDRRNRVRQLLGPSAGPSTLREVVEGRQVLMRVPLAGAERIMERLSDRGLPMRTAVGRWAPLPRGIAWSRVRWSSPASPRDW